MSLPAGAVTPRAPVPRLRRRPGRRQRSASPTSTNDAAHRYLLQLICRGSHKEFVCDLRYGQASAYMPLTAGTYVFSVVPEGQPWTKAMVTQTVQLSGGSDYTMSVVSQHGKDGSMLLNDSTTQPSPGDASLETVGRRPRVGPVRVALSNGTVLTPDLGYLDATGYADVPPASGMSTSSPPPADTCWPVRCRWLFPPGVSIPSFSSTPPTVRFGSSC